MEKFKNLFTKVVFKFCAQFVNMNFIKNKMLLNYKILNKNFNFQLIILKININFIIKIKIYFNI